MYGTRLKADRRAGTASSGAARTPAIETLRHPLVPLPGSSGSHSFQRRVQAKLTISDPNDIYEKEADRIADQVMRMPGPAVSGNRAIASNALPDIQRRCAACTEKQAEDKIYRKQHTAEALDLTPETERHIGSLNGRGQPLPDATRAFFEPRFGVDFGAVRVHTDTSAAASARNVNALAYTVGRDVVFNSGQYAPQSDSGKRLLAHELTHVVQQNMNAGGTPGMLARQTSGGGSVAAPAGSMRGVKVWVHSFIPMAMVADPFGRCYSGDSRGFDNAIHASYRTHQEVQFDAMSGAKTIDWSDVGATHLVDCTTGAVRATAKASVAGLANGPVISAGAGRYTLNIVGEATNPLAPVACAISLNLNVTIDTAARTCTVQGEHDGFPAYEVYVTADGGAGVPVYTYDPTVAGEGPLALCGGLDKTASGTTTF